MTRRIALAGVAACFLFCSAVAAVEVTVARTSSWSGGYNGQIRLRNDQAAAVSEWQLGFHASTTLTSVWNAVTLSASGGDWLLGNASWNGTIGPGTTVAIGFGGTGELVDGSISGCRFNGAACTVTYVDEAGGSGGAAAISLAGVPASAIRVNVAAGAMTSHGLSVGGDPSATFTVISNNPSVVDARIVNGATLQLRGLAAGRAGVLLKSVAGNAVRRIGVAVGAGASAPGMPPHLAIGSVSEDTPADLDFWWDIGAGRRNRRVDVRYIYLNGGSFAGWDTWSNEPGGRARSFIRESRRLGFIPYFVFYNIPDSGEDYTLDLAHMQSASYMAAYFRNLALALRIANEESPDDTVGFLFEPDFIGYMAQQSGQRPATLQAATHAAYDAGILVAGSDPVFPNTLTGLVSAINYLVAKTAPQVQFGWQVNLWASPPGGFTTTVPGNGLMHKTDAVGVVAGRPLIYDEAAAITRYYVEAGVASHGADFISIDKYGLDAVGHAAAGATDPSQAPWFWHSDHWFNYLTFVRAMRAQSGLPVVLWQLPVGRINRSLLPNPYANNAPFPDLSNTVTRYEDSAPSFFLGDTFQVSGIRRTWFSRNEGAAPGIVVGTDQVTWPSRMQEARDAGVSMILFGAGVGASTDGVGSPPTDDYWWISRVQDYYDAPVLLQPPSDLLFRDGFQSP
ncbi:cellulose-binding domain-containing protein [Tahibacter amnicola]|uniref:Cellulose-binding domain-containing protein n=1 Tax=Tahibacter amnicola TaxID=2976241 RepID=A0ABY6B9T1_9GAMM|nr:cellulose-binding domain-containing protein [Tahibacter amnicola]UXI66542.1 cellulose-binding domain-containing protein [Tahibacter amnicola]